MGRYGANPLSRRCIRMPTYGSTLKKAGKTALDLGVYLPLGATVKARDMLLSRERLADEYRSMVERGRETLGQQQERLERVRLEAKERGREARESMRGQVREIGQRAEKVRKQATSTARTTAARSGAAPSVEDLPIARYDDLTAQEVADQLNGLTQEELAELYGYERRHQGRSTILQAIEPRLVDLPISGYDELTADEIVKELSDLSESELLAIRDYEKKTKSRQTVLERIESLLAA
jgi:ferritin-like metal-binding protein YciE